MVKSNRLKQTKHKRQTKRKMRRQIGGDKTIDYLEHRILLKPGTSPTNVVIPGYLVFYDMLGEYKNVNIHKKKLDDGIRSKDVAVYTDCKDPDPTTPDTTIIVLKKPDSMFFSNTSITCKDAALWNLSSHNFKIFIEILNWNPFLNIPIYLKSGEHEGSQSYGHHEYKGDPTFKNPAWWGHKSWWPSVKLRLEELPAEKDAQPVSSLAAPADDAPPIVEEFVSVETKVQRLEAKVQRLQGFIPNFRAINDHLQLIQQQVDELQTLRRR